MGVPGWWELEKQAVKQVGLPALARPMLHLWGGSAWVAELGAHWLESVERLEAHHAVKQSSEEGAHWLAHIVCCNWIQRVGWWNVCRKQVRSICTLGIAWKQCIHRKHKLRGDEILHRFICARTPGSTHFILCLCLSNGLFAAWTHAKLINQNSGWRSKSLWNCIDYFHGRVSHSVIA